MLWAGAKKTSLCIVGRRWKKKEPLGDFGEQSLSPKGQEACPNARESFGRHHPCSLLSVICSLYLRHEGGGPQQRFHVFVAFCCPGDGAAGIKPTGKGV